MLDEEALCQRVIAAEVVVVLTKVEHRQQFGILHDEQRIVHIFLIVLRPLAVEHGFLEHGDVFLCCR